MSTRRGASWSDVAEAKARFSDIVRKALSGEEILIARDNKPILKLVPLESLRRRRPGSARGQVWMAPDFDEIPEGFDEYR